MSQNTSHAVMQQRHAKALGLSRYFTGRPCPRGHISERLVANWTCIDCINEKAREARNSDLDGARKKERDYHRANREQRNAHSRVSYRRHIEKRREYERARYQDPERRAWQKSQAAAWGRENPGKHNAYVKARRAKLKKACPTWLTEEQRRVMRDLYIRARTAGPNVLNVDHIVPLNGENVCGLHVPWNLQILPNIANKEKGNRLVECS